MVQVDVFWSYGIGASFATAATHQLRSAAGPARHAGRWSDPYLMATVLYCAVLFAPSGAWLLWGFPDWETMQAADGHGSLPAWLVALFAATNVSQGVLGYWVAARLIASGRVYAAFLQAGLGYTGMFFILVHGWDGRGYQRFFSADRESFATWPAQPAPGETLSRMGDWLTSPVALTLYGMGIVLVPVMLALMIRWLRSGQRQASATVSGRLRILGTVLGAVFGLALGTAVGASVLVHLLGWWLGVPVAVALAALLVVRRGAAADRLFALLALPPGGTGSLEPVR
ncbi:hypothetical protein OHA61_11160 [Streptomyces sp. NBC_00885]|uniref:hypothetical protein n=1 Tax=Streptomyces sp. NBC_00885 TaxID=2975857 RepID=UPI00386E80F7|nr:hypothetical protein OHA61_11160 [Streptomyces sp. NBC_00885]